MSATGINIMRCEPEMAENRAEHLAWAKQRALEYLDAGDLGNAIASMVSDLGKHPETRSVPLRLQQGLRFALENDTAGVRQWINEIDEAMSDQPVTMERIALDLDLEAEKLRIFRDAARKRGDMELAKAYGDRAAGFVTAANSVRKEAGLPQHPAGEFY